MSRQKGSYAFPPNVKKVFELLGFDDKDPEMQQARDLLEQVKGREREFLAKAMMGGLARMVQHNATMKKTNAGIDAYTRVGMAADELMKESKKHIAEGNVKKAVYITSGALRTASGANPNVVKKWLEDNQAEIDKFHKKAGLEASHNNRNTDMKETAESVKEAVASFLASKKGEGSTPPPP